MIPIVKNEEIAPNIFELVVKHPQLAWKAQPGHFVIVMAEETSERVPLTIADFDHDEGTITLVVMSVGTSTKKIVHQKAGESLFALIGPLGHPSELGNFGTVIMVAGGVGTAPIYPITRALHDLGNNVISIQGARNKNLLFWTEKLAAVSNAHIIMTDDGTAGGKGLVTDPLRAELEKKQVTPTVGCVYMIGPAMMMKFCTKTIEPYNVKGIASLNSIMIDGTGMCGGCRVKVGGQTKFTCVDGPEFDAREIDWDVLLSRQKMYHDEEQCSLKRYTTGK